LKIVLAVGLPGAGKSTYFRKLGVNAISSDALRLQLVDDENNQTIHPQVFAAMRYLLLGRIGLRRPITYLDATNLTVGDRSQWIKIARENQCEVEAIYFDVPLETCKQRNAARHRAVPEKVLDEMYTRLVPPSLDEGFSRIEVVKSPLGRPPVESAN
jgi:predicted kinase